jgi:hypothetical protein
MTNSVEFEVQVGSKGVEISRGTGANAPAPDEQDNDEL